MVHPRKYTKLLPCSFCPYSEKFTCSENLFLLGKLSQGSLFLQHTRTFSSGRFVIVNFCPSVCLCVCSNHQPGRIQRSQTVNGKLSLPGPVIKSNIHVLCTCSPTHVETFVSRNLGGGVQLTFLRHPPHSVCECVGDDM